MVARPSEAEAILLAKRVARDASDRAELVRPDYVLRGLSLLFWTVGVATILGIYGRELAANFGTSRELVWVIVILTGGLTQATVEIAILHRKIGSLTRLLQSTQSHA